MQKAFKQYVEHGKIVFSVGIKKELNDNGEWKKKSICPQKMGAAKTR